MRLWVWLKEKEEDEEASLDSIKEGKSLADTEKREKDRDERRGFCLS